MTVSTIPTVVSGGTVAVSTRVTAAPAPPAGISGGTLVAVQPAQAQGTVVMSGQPPPTLPQQPAAAGQIICLPASAANATGVVVSYYFIPHRLTTPQN